MGLELISTLREFLKGKECLVIFDGVWKEAFWGDIEHALVDDKVGRRILITTRKMKVAEFCKSLSPVLSFAKRESLGTLFYFELPYYLKSCLLYFGMLSRLRSIRNARLNRQWIAEGFVQAVVGTILEEVAQEYMNELIDRSLVEASSLDGMGKARKCHVHDLMYEIILKKTMEASFSQVLPGNSTNQPEFRGIKRRLSIMSNGSNNDLQFNSFSHVQSVIVVHDDEILNFILPRICDEFQVLKSSASENEITDLECNDPSSTDRY
ncbi:hypothetical protein TIFTF001_038343, partial [Ficus carica]